MSSRGFHIEILHQDWLVADPDSAMTDLCSHGRLRLIIGGQTVADGSEDHGISETGLALLRTLDRDHTAEAPVVDMYPSPRLVFHGCGLMLMSGCPIGINWEVRHLAGRRVRISDVCRFDTTSEAEVVAFPGLDIEISESEYRDVVVQFARQAKELFVGISKSMDCDWVQQQYEQFWQEYDSLLEKYGNGPLT